MSEDTKPPRASSEPATDAFDEEDHLTPLDDVVERLEVSKGFVLSTRDIALVRALHEESANRLMRSRQKRISPAPYTQDLENRINSIEETLVEKFGKSGKNGDVGTLKERVDKAESRRWWAVTFLAGLLVTVIGSAIAFGSWMGSIEADVEMLKQRRINRSTPEYPAAREATP